LKDGSMERFPSACTGRVLEDSLEKQQNAEDQVVAGEVVEGVSSQLLKLYEQNRITQASSSQGSEAEGNSTGVCNQCSTVNSETNTKESSVYGHFQTSRPPNLQQSSSTGESVGGNEAHVGVMNKIDKDKKQNSSNGSMPPPDIENVDGLMEKGHYVKQNLPTTAEDMGGPMESKEQYPRAPHKQNYVSEDKSQQLDDTRKHQKGYDHPQLVGSPEQNRCDSTVLAVFLKVATNGSTKLSPECDGQPYCTRCVTTMTGKVPSRFLLSLGLDNLEEMQQEAWEPMSHMDLLLAKELRPMADPSLELAAAIGARSDGPTSKMTVSTIFKSASCTSSRTGTTLMLTAPLQMVSIDKFMLALCAMSVTNELVRLAFSPCVGVKPTGFMSEVSRELGIVIIGSSAASVKIFRDERRQSDIFCYIISMAAAADKILPVVGSRNGALLLMQAELQVLSSLGVLLLWMIRPWNPGILAALCVTVAWGQATFRRGGNVTSDPLV
jgi:hypothetical protein